MPGLSSINTALSGLIAQQRAMETIGNDIANSQTEGFTRRRVDLAPAGGVGASGVWSKNNSTGTGVTVAGITRMGDELLDLRARSAMAGDSNASTTQTILGTLEQISPEPSDNGIAAKLSAFWSSWEDAAAAPGDLGSRASLLASAQNLTTSFRDIATSATNYRDQLTSGLNSLVNQVNNDSAQVAALNSQIIAAKGAGVDASDLEDQRGLILDRLVKTTGATTQINSDGSAAVFLGGSTLVRGISSENIKVTTGGTLDPPLDSTGLPKVGLQWATDGYAVTGLSGEMAADMTGINSSVPQYLADVNKVASTLVSTVNSLHTSGHGLDTTNDVNLKFFDPAGTTAATIAISTDVAGQPSRIALGSSTGGALDGSLGYQIGALADSTTGADAVHRTVVSRLANDVSVAASRSTVQTKIAQQAASDRQAVVGVSLDEEMTALIAAQHAYAASSRVLTGVDDMLDTLISHTGRVGL